MAIFLIQPVKRHVGGHHRCRSALDGHQASSKKGMCTDKAPSLAACYVESVAGTSYPSLRLKSSVYPEIIDMLQHTLKS